MEIQAESPFDKSVCCLCTQSVWRKLGLSQFLTTILIMAAFAGFFCNVAVYSTPSYIGTGVETAGLWLHLSSLLLTIIFTSYLGRYVSGLQHAKDNEFRTFNCCDGYYFYASLGYIMTGLYWLATFVFYACIAGNYDHGRNMTVINQYSKGIMMYYISSVILWYWVVIFKPFIPNICNSTNVNSLDCYLPMTSERKSENTSYSWFVRFFTYYGFFEHERDVKNYNIWSSLSLLLQFCASVIVMNCSFAVYYNDRLYHDVTTAVSTSSVIISIFLQGCIVYASYKRYGTLDDLCNSSWQSIAAWWISLSGLWLIVGFLIAGIYMPYKSWAIDTNYPETSMMRNIFFIVQGVPFACGIVIGFIYVLYLFRYIPSCCQACCQPLKDEITDAQNKVKGYQQTFDVPVVSSSEISMSEEEKR